MAKCPNCNNMLPLRNTLLLIRSRILTCPICGVKLRQKVGLGYELFALLAVVFGVLCSLIVIYDSIILGVVIFVFGLIIIEFISIYLTKFIVIQ